MIKYYLSKLHSRKISQLETEVDKCQTGHRDQQSQKTKLRKFNVDLADQINKNSICQTKKVSSLSQPKYKKFNLRPLKLKKNLEFISPPRVHQKEQEFEYFEDKFRKNRFSLKHMCKRTNSAYDLPLILTPKLTNSTSKNKLSPEKQPKLKQSIFENGCDLDISKINKSPEPNESFTSEIQSILTPSRNTKENLHTKIEILSNAQTQSQSHHRPETRRNFRIMRKNYD